MDVQLFSIDKLTIEETEPGHFFVICGDRFAKDLMRDEALGVVASLLFKNNGVPYLTTYAHTRIYNRQPVAGLLPATVAPMPTSDFIIYRRELIADAKGI